MNAVVTFVTERGSYAIDVAHTGAVVALESEPQPLPAPRPGIGGVVRIGEQTLTVLTALGEDGDRLLLVDAGGRRFALRVREVTGVVRIGAGEGVQPPPAGQREPVVCGIVAGALLLDPDELARSLQ